jgi:hypothetical protein
MSPGDYLLRNEIISLKKLQAEGRMEESKTVLGWFLNTRQLLISLPTDKYVQWSTDIMDLIASTRVNTKQMERMVGRLNHAGSIIPMMHHFLSHLYHALQRMARNGWTCLRLLEKSDLHLMKKFLTSAHEGISMNNVIFRKPTHPFRSDALEFGLGGTTS